jgi:hypothetical protein
MFSDYKAVVDGFRGFETVVPANGDPVMVKGQHGLEASIWMTGGRWVIVHISLPEKPWHWLGVGTSFEAAIEGIEPWDNEESYALDFPE